MCNLYSVRTSRAALARKFGLSDNRMAAFEPLPAIFPGHMAPIIKQSADGERELVMRSWGFILLRDGYAPKRVTNTRDDKVDDQVLEGQLREAALPGAGDGLLRTGRRQASSMALVRAEGRGGAAAVRVRRHLPAVERADQEGRPQRRHRGVLVHDDAAEHAHQTINHERSPVLLTEEDEFATWLTGTPEEAFGLIKTSDPDRMRIVQSGFEKEDSFSGLRERVAVPVRYSWR